METPKERLKITCTVKDEGGRTCGWYHVYHVTDPRILHGKSVGMAQKIQAERVQQCIGEFFQNHMLRAHPNEAQAITTSIQRVTNVLTVKYMSKMIYTEQV